MKQKTQLLSKSLIGLLAFSLIAAGCTKKRDASLSDADAPNTFAISEFGDVQDINSAYSVNTDAKANSFSLSEKAKASNEAGKVDVSNAKVPGRLQFMFENLSISGQATQNLPVTFGVDKDFVTAYKIVSSLDGLSALEKQYARSRDEVAINNKLMRATQKDARQSLSSQLQSVRQKRELLKAGTSAGSFLVPIFKYAITAYGTVQRTKNEVGDETSSLTLLKTDWAAATHIQISARNDDQSPMSIKADDQEKLDRTFSASKLDKQVMTADELTNTFQIRNSLQPEALVYTTLDSGGLWVDQIVQKSKLTDSQRKILDSGLAGAIITQCPAILMEKLATTHPELKQDCTLISKLGVKVGFVRVKIPVKDGVGNQTNEIQLEDVGYSQNVGLVNIPINIESKKLDAADVSYDSSAMIRVFDIKNKEFFFRRTLEDAPFTTTFMVGEAGAVQNVKFEMQDQRLVVRMSDKVINYKTGSNEQEVEDLMSIPVTYFRRETTDAKGDNLAYRALVKTNKDDAEYIMVDWTLNTLPASESPISYYGNGQCLTHIADSVVQDVDNRFDKGILSFSFQYTSSIAQDLACIGLYQAAGDYNGNKPNQFNVRLKERISFKLNDGSTDVSYVPHTPFRAQNNLGYGTWTIGQISPDAHGLHGREGTQNDLPVVQDFRNGKKLVYTLTGMPADAARKKLYVDTVREIVEAWNQAYKRAFKGTVYERSGDYLEVQVSGENGLNAHIGDLDRNIIHFENKFNDNHGTLGVSQVGFNSRSGIVVADSLIVFAGNLEKYVASVQRNLKISNAYHDRIEKFKTEAMAELKTTADDTAAKAGNSGTPGVNVQSMKGLGSGSTMLQGFRIDPAQAKNLRASAELKNFIRERQALGRSDKFQYGASQAENAYVERVFKKALESSDIDSVDLEGLMAQEMLATASGKMELEDKAKLQARAGLMMARNQMKEHFKNQPGCMLTSREALGRGYADEGFEKGMVRALHFDLGHEMGHSQGLTHNFIGSMDKVNFSDEGIAADAPADSATRNYSSIMDYIEPAQLKWDGIGSYDVHALRASHTGLLELNASGIEAIQKVDPKGVIDGKWVHVNTIQKNFAKNGWTTFTKEMANALVRPYKYCTDIDVGYEPTCQRFDLGTTASEIMDNIILDYDEHYITSYYSWDRYDFNWAEKGAALAGTQRTMILMRQFMDETFYKAIVDKDNAAVGDNAQASIKAYLFLNQLIHTPDASSKFLSKERFTATVLDVPSDDGKKTIKTPAVIEKRSLGDIQVDKRRLDTIGLELDKSLAMQVLTMKGIGYAKYERASLEMSYMDFEKYLLGMTTDNSLIAHTLGSMFLDNLEPTFSIPGAPFQKADGLKSETSATMRYYAGISAVLNLQASTLRDKDNFANLFKVASSLGKAPTDRVSLNQLGVSSNSQARLSYYALDGATVSQNMLDTANKMNFFLNNAELDQALFDLADSNLDSLIAQLQAKKDQFGVEARRRSARAVAAKAKLVAVLKAQNVKGDIVALEEIKANPAVSMENLANIIDNLNQQILGSSVGVLVGNEDAKKAAPQIAAQANAMADQLQLFGSAEKAILKAVTAKNVGNKDNNLLKVVKESVTSTETFDVKYGVIMKNIEFLSKLTRMTDPDYSR